MFTNTKKNEKISRNEKCEATGKKFKNCCGDFIKKILNSLIKLLLQINH